jgi:hypothetical protein
VITVIHFRFTKYDLFETIPVYFV